MFKVLKKQHPNLYSIIIGISIVMFWRGVWGLLDTYFLPNHKIISYIISIIVGLILLFLNDFKLDELE